MQVIHEVTLSCHRQETDITLLAISKGRPSTDIKQAVAAGITNFGESYLQEALPKLQALSSLPITWHFIGPIQSNKADSIAQHFAWVHSVSRQSIAERLNNARPAHCPPLNICIQVNLDEETSKSGVTINAVSSLATAIMQLPRLTLRGLMLIPKNESDESLQTLSFLRLKSLMHHLNQELNLNMDTLSMGMSHDFPAAIRAGSTILRIGTALFGTRP